MQPDREGSHGVTTRHLLSRRRLLALVGTAGALAACGEADAPPLTPSPATPTVPASTATAVAAPRQTAASQPPAASEPPPPASPTPERVTPPPAVDDGLRRLDGYGFQAHLYNQDRRLIVDRTIEAGFGWLKQQVEWRQTEPIEKGGFDWRELDKVVAGVGSAGLKLLLSVVRAPEWALGDRPHGPPADPLDFRDFMQALAGRYRGHVQAYELWNEANLAREWGYGRIDAGEFVELMLAGHQGVKAGDPEAITVGGALTPAGDVDIPDQQVQAVDDVRFLEQIYAYRDGIARDAFDAWGVHPGGFNNAPTQEIGSERGAGWNGHGSFYFQRFTQHRAVMEANGDGDKPMWLTEMGWSTANADPAYGFGADNSGEDQAQFLVDAFQLIRETAPYITHAFVWNLNFQSVVGPQDEKFAFGVLRPDGSPRPAFTALQEMTKGSATRPTLA